MPQNEKMTAVVQNDSPDNVIVQEPAKLLSATKSDTDPITGVAPTPSITTNISTTMQNNVPLDHSQPQPCPANKIDPRYDIVFLCNIDRNISKLTGLIVICISIFILMLFNSHLGYVYSGSKSKYEKMCITAGMYYAMFTIFDRVIIPEGLMPLCKNCDFKSWFFPEKK